MGGTIHDVAQVVGAGFSISPEVGENATLVKLIRVAMLAPVVLIFSLAYRSSSKATTGNKPPLLPGFVVGFLILAILNSIGLIPPFISEAAGNLSRWFLLIAIAAVGLKTSLKKMLDVGGVAIALIVAETVFLGGYVLIGLRLID